MIYYFILETIEDLGEGEKSQHEDRDIFYTHEGLSKAHRSSRCNAEKDI